MEINKDQLDRIIISSNAQMQKIMDWFYEIQRYLKKVNEEINPDNNLTIAFPLATGLIRFEEEGIEVVFQRKPGRTEMIAYVRRDENSEFIKCFSFWFDPMEKRDDEYSLSEKVRDLKVFTGDQKAAQQLRFMVGFDGTCAKIMAKFIAIMMFMLFNEEIVEVDHSQDKPRTKREIRKLKASGGSALSLVRKTYVIKDFDEKKLRLPGQPRKWTAPDHEVNVRGHYRHLKSGKVVWVRECSKFKDKGNRKPKTWKM